MITFSLIEEVFLAKKNKYFANMAEQMKLKGMLKGHGDWVTQIATNARYPNMIISSSRGYYFSSFFF